MANRVNVTSAVEPRITRPSEFAALVTDVQIRKTMIADAEPGELKVAFLRAIALWETVAERNITLVGLLQDLQGVQRPNANEPMDAALLAKSAGFTVRIPWTATNLAVSLEESGANPDMLQDEFLDILSGWEVFTGKNEELQRKIDAIKDENKWGGK